VKLTIPLSFLVLATLLQGCGATALPEVRNPQVQLQSGDHIVILGSGIADRMQHHGWLETFIQLHYPSLQLVIRNQGFTGDRINHRPRSSGFMSVDDYLNLSQADVLIAMYGFNESFDGDPAGFQNNLTQWILETRGKDYNGEGPPKIVLVSPLAHENLHHSNLPDGRNNNMRLGAYAEATHAAAKENHTGFIDLYSISQALYAAGGDVVTQNGVLPTEAGSRRLAEELVWSLLGTKPNQEISHLEKTRAAVLDKNWHWFNRFRATDGNDVWGGRSKLAFVDGQTNREVLQNELNQLDVMTANRDEVIWAAAKGVDKKVDDSNVPADIEVISNLEKEQLQGGVSKTGSNTYISGEAGVGKMKLADGLQANLFASEEMFPELVNPVQLGVDTRGRLWAAAWKTYPKWQPLKKMDDRLLILPDENRDGVADQAITFAYVHNPTGFEFWNGGVIVCSGPDFLFLKDTDGDDVADVRIRMLSGIGTADTHHTANNFLFGPGGFLYYQRGIFNVSNVESPWQSNQQSGTSGMYRFNPRTYEFSFHAPNSPNPHGAGFDNWGYQYATSGTTGHTYQVRPNGKGGFTMRKLLDHTVRPVPSSTILSSAHFPKEMQGNFLIANSIAFLGIKQYRLDRNSETGNVHGVEVEDLLVSSDLNFRPTDMEFGDDGAMYVSDWANAIIGHMQHNIRDPARDHDHGRIYRLTYPDRPLSPHVEIDGQPITVLLDTLKHPVDGVRQRARVELSERDTAEVIPALRHWLHQFDKNKSEDAHHLMEGLWLFQQHNIENRPFLESLLKSPEPHARIAAATVEQFWNHNASTPNAKPSEQAEAATTAMAKPDADAIVIGTIPEQMLYDKTEFSVKAGQKVKIWFQNPDYMPHNLIIGMPGSAEEIGKAAEALGASGFEKQFIPENDQILAATTLINHLEHFVLEFTAPSQAGEYDYLCTFPGHWQRMRGTMKVTP